MNDKKNDRFQLLLKYLALSHKGLTSEELEKLTNLTQQQLKIVKKALSPVILEVEGCFRFYSYYFIRGIIRELIGKDAISLYKDIGEVLSLTPSSVRKLEEHIHVLSEAKEWFQLKQIVSTIENFLILFNPVHKYVLGKCWEGLIGQNYDPVIEYNKSLELFEMHYQPSIENLVRIVLQLSRFFKEMVDFEASTLPEFRHPLIKNRLLTLEQKKEKNEKSQKEKTTTTKQEKDTTKEVEGSDAGFFQEDSRIAPEDFSIDSNDIERQEHHQGKCKNHLEDIGMLREVKHMKMYDKLGKCEILKGYEKCNVDIPAGLNQYLEVFDNIIKEEDEKKRLYPIWTENEIVPVELSIHGNSEDKVQNNQHQKTSSALNFKSVSRAGSASNFVTRQQIWSQNELINLNDLKEIKDNDSVSEKQEETKRTQKFLDYEQFEDLKVNIDLTNDKEENYRQFYFYKRWIWIMFPWACMSVEPNGSFSDRIHKCFSNDLHYIKVMDELEITHKAQMIAIEAKLKKKAVLEALRGDCLIDPELMKLDEELKLTDRAHNIRESLGGYGFFEGLSQVGARRNTATNLKFFAGEINRKSMINSEKKQSSENVISPGKQSTGPVSPKASKLLQDGPSRFVNAKSQGENLFLTDLAFDNKDSKRVFKTSSRTVGSQSQSRIMTAMKTLGFSKE